MQTCHTAHLQHPERREGQWWAAVDLLGWRWREEGMEKVGKGRTVLGKGRLYQRGGLGSGCHQIINLPLESQAAHMGLCGSAPAQT